VATPTHHDRDAGFSLIELILVVAIMAVLATMTVLSLVGVSRRGQDEACGVDARALRSAGQVYLAIYGQGSGSLIATDAYSMSADTAYSASPAVSRPAGVDWARGATPQQTLVNAKLMASTSPLVWLEPDGTTKWLSDRCGMIGGPTG